MKISKEFKIGVLGVISLAMFYFGFHFLKGSDFFSTTTHFYILYDDVKGLTVANPVQISGVAIGRVTKVEVLQNNQNKVLVTIDIEKNIKLPAKTTAILGDDGLIGGKIIILKFGKEKKYLAQGDTLVGGLQPGMLDAITSKLDPISQKADSVMTKLNNLLTEFNGIGTRLNNTIEVYKMTGENVNGIMVETRGKIGGVFDNMKVLSGNLIQTEQSFKPVIQKMNAFADSLQRLQLSQTLGKANQTLTELQTLLGKLNRGEGSLGALLKDEALYQNLNNTTIEVQKLLIDIRKNPKRYKVASVF
jgi:phospholipid/cholesterol/gamma-HCH transport system substrate-binding protein